MDAATKDRLNETVVESLAESLQMAKADRDNFQQQGQFLATLLTAVLLAVSSSGDLELTPEQIKRAEGVRINWKATPEGGFTLATVE